MESRRDLVQATSIVLLWLPSGSCGVLLLVGMALMLS